MSFLESLQNHKHCIILKIDLIRNTNFPSDKWITVQWIRKRLPHYITACVCEITLRLRGRAHCPLHKRHRISLFLNTWQLYIAVDKQRKINRIKLFSHCYLVSLRFNWTEKFGQLFLYELLSKINFLHWQTLHIYFLIGIKH